ncbi:MAG: ABC transporter permease [Anaerolineae bacterium]
MTRMLSMLRCDLRVQWRNGFYFASAFIVVIWLALLSLMPRESMNAAVIVPALVFLNLLVNTFYFVGGLVLLEKGEGTLAGLTVTPLRSGEYLVARCLSLTLLGVGETLVIVIVTYGVGFHVGWLLLGAAALGAFYTLVGFVAVTRFASLNEYLIPSGFIVAALVLPLVDYLGLLTSPVFYLHPVQPMLMLLRAAFGDTTPLLLIYGIVGSALWIGAAFYAAQRVFVTFVVRTV